MVPLRCLITCSRGRHLTLAGPIRVPSYTVDIRIQRFPEWNKDKCSCRHLCISLQAGKWSQPVCRGKKKAYEQPEAERKDRPDSGFVSGSSVFLRPGCTPANSYAEPNPRNHDQWLWHLPVGSVKHHGILPLFLLKLVSVGNCFNQVLAS